ETAITTLLDALATTGHWYARRVLVEQVGNTVAPRLRKLALERRKLERWELARALDQLGERQQPIATYVDLELALARRCKDKIAALDKIGDARRPEAEHRLRELLAKPKETCLHEAARAALEQI